MTVLNESVLDQKLHELEKVRTWSPRLVSRLEALLRSDDDYAVFRINPIQFARERNVAEQEVIDLFLQATRLGLLQMFWNLMCPACGGAVQSLRSLSAIHNEYYCAFCVANFTAELDDYIHVTFTVSPAVREIIFHHPERLSAEDFIFKVHFSREARIPGGPTVREMFRSMARGTARLAAGANQTFALDVANGALLLASTDEGSGRTFVMLEGELSREPQVLALAMKDRENTPTEAKLRPGRIELAITNNRQSEQIVMVGHLPPEFLTAAKKPSIFDPFLSARRLLTSQTFRDLYRNEVFQASEGISVKDTNILFTDLKGSTAMYDRIGDLNAYALVRQHFERLGKVIYGHEGAVVKTIGDAIMASFATPVGAVQAALEMLREIEEFNRERGSRDIILKVGVHRGGSIAVTLNERLDYFGQTINIGARIQGLADADEVYLSHEAYSAPGVKDVLTGCEVATLPARLKGVAGEMTVYRVHLPGGRPHMVADDAAVDVGVSRSRSMTTRARWVLPAAVCASGLIGLVVGKIAFGAGASAIPTSAAQVMASPAVTDQAVGEAAPVAAAAPPSPGLAPVSPDTSIETAKPAEKAPVEALTAAERRKMRRALLGAVKKKAWATAVDAGGRLRAAEALDWESHLALADALLGAGDDVEARGVLEAFVTTYPTNKKINDARFRLGELLERAGDGAGAKELFQKVAEASGGSLQKQARAKLH